MKRLSEASGRIILLPMEPFSRFLFDTWKHFYSSLIGRHAVYQQIFSKNTTC